MELRLCPRVPNWKGFLRLSLVTCPVALYPATCDSEKTSFNQINRNTGHRIKYLKVDADTGEEVSSEDIMKGYKVDTDSYIEITKEPALSHEHNSTQMPVSDRICDVGHGFRWDVASGKGQLFVRPPRSGVGGNLLCHGPPWPF